MHKFNRVILLVLDSCGVGELPDAKAYGDVGSNTIGNTAEFMGGLKMPNMGKLGLGNIIPIEGVPAVDSPGAYYGKMAEQSSGKDSTMGHWEIAGLISSKPFPVYPDGFPREIIDKFKERTGHGVLGNKAASGTEIIAELGEKHIRTGDLIVYTSADSVFQIAAHTDVVPLKELYKYCQIARGLLRGEHAVSRVIARPFVGKPGEFVRTPDRKDFSLEPTGSTLLDNLDSAGYDVITVGKVDYLFAERGVTQANHTRSNAEGIEVTIEKIKNHDFSGLLFINLVDFDMLWGHRNNARDFAGGLEYFDTKLPEILAALRDNDLFIITADHGCDPTTPSTDHSREYVPLLVYANTFQGAERNLGVRETFADLAATVADIFGIKKTESGKSFAGELV
jgi:phosphopentomutase